MKVKSVKKIIIGIGVILCATVINIQAAEYKHEVKAKKISFAWSVEGDKLAVKLAACESHRLVLFFM